MDFLSRVRCPALAEQGKVARAREAQASSSASCAMMSPQRLVRLLPFVMFFTASCICLSMRNSTILSFCRPGLLPGQSALLLESSRSHAERSANLDLRQLTHPPRLLQWQDDVTVLVARVL